MSKKNLTDYYPVYKEIGGTPAMFNAEELIDKALKCGYNTFQKVVLLVKNAFEGHVYLTFQIKPDQLYREGTILLKEKPVLLVQNFYEQFETYLPGLLQIEAHIKALQVDYELDKISFETVIRYILTNHLIRYPVSIFSAFNNGMLKKLAMLSPKVLDQNFRLAILGERFLGEFALVEKTNELYFEKFKELGQQLHIREEVLMHYQRKLMLAPNVKTEHELEDLLYRNLVEEKLNCKSQHNIDFRQYNPLENESLTALENFRGKIKILFRLISKNCAEVHTSTETEDRFHALNGIFQEASLINNLPALQIPETFLQFMHLVSLLAQVLVYRKSNEFAIATAFPVITAGAKEMLISTGDLKLIERNLDEKLIGVRIKFFTEYKMRFVVDDELTEMHQQFLKQQIEYINNQILQIQSEITEVLKVKTEIETQKKEE
jgi:hypothetical protein